MHKKTKRIKQSSADEKLTETFFFNTKSCTGSTTTYIDIYIHIYACISMTLNNYVYVYTLIKIFKKKKP